MKSLRESLLRSVNEADMSQLERELKSYRLKSNVKIDFVDHEFDYVKQRDIPHKIRNWNDMVKYGNKVLAVGLMRLDQWFKPGASFEVYGEWDEDSIDFEILVPHGKLHIENPISPDDILINRQNANDLCMPMNGDKSDPLYNEYGWDSGWLIDCYLTFLEKR